MLRGTSPSPQRSELLPTGRRGSTTQTPPSTQVERCTTTGVRSLATASTAAGMVAEVFTTTRSPGSRNVDSSVKALWTSWPVER